MCNKNIFLVVVILFVFFGGVGNVVRKGDEGKEYVCGKGGLFRSS